MVPITVWDASALISYLEAGDANSVAARALAETDGEFLIHPITLAECLVGAVRAGKPELVHGVVDALEITVWQPGTGEPDRLAQLRVKTGLPIPDCCVLSAGTANAATVATFDQRLAKAARHLGLSVAPRGTAESATPSDPAIDRPQAIVPESPQHPAAQGESAAPHRSG
ncbi:MAG: PIN domain-containing protein [Bifidobacteriaceae bacterium]|jgi:predicted nucleic acid-binding protein|nr:PIN domain-containing protein [Bifidobacteriaceae bacterium]